MLLRFEGGPLDGLEESSNSSPAILFRGPPASEMLYLLQTADLDEATPPFGAFYELVNMDILAGIALYFPIEE
jgi:hypothetical protein